MGFLDTLLEAFELGGADLRAWGLAWARVAPTVTLVPAFGLRAVPTAVRIALGLAMAMGIAPALSPIAVGAGAWPVELLVQFAKGLPVALSAAVALWAATMAGGVIDNLRGSQLTASIPSVESGATPTGVLFSMLAALAFLETGGAARIAVALSDPALTVANPLVRASADIAVGIQLAIAVAAPVLAASVVIEVGGALVARAASPAFIQPLLAPLRSIAILGVAALVFDRMVAVLIGFAVRVP